VIPEEPLPPSQTNSKSQILPGNIPTAVESWFIEKMTDEERGDTNKRELESQKKKMTIVNRMKKLC
jgi:hypothetical protein